MTETPQLTEARLLAEISRLRAVLDRIARYVPNHHAGEIARAALDQTK